MPSDRAQDDVVCGVTEGMAADSGPPVTQAVKSQFWQRLLDGMAASIRERGYIDTTIADIVRHACTSRRTFYECFPSKEACFIALHTELNAELARQIAAAVDPHADLSVQVRQAIVTWFARVEADPAIELSWIRAVSRLGAAGRRLQRESLEAFIVLIRALTDTADLRAAGVKPASRQMAIMLLGGLNELVAVTLEDGGDIRDITETAIDCTLAILGPRNRHLRPAAMAGNTHEGYTPARSRSMGEPR
jgi:AcrR family transcriptional regulator